MKITERKLGCSLRSVSFMRNDTKERIMFGKLLKYDLKAIGRIMIPFWIAVFLTGLLWAHEDLKYDAYISSDYYTEKTSEIPENMLIILGILFVMLIALVLVMNLIVVIQYFWKGLLKEEGYLMFTLPVTERSLILSKAVSAMIISAGTLMVGILLFITIEIMSKTEMQDFLEFYFDGFDTYWQGILFVAALLLCNMLKGIYMLYAAMSMGQLTGRNRFLCAAGAFCCLMVGTYVFETITVYAAALICGQDMLYHFENNAVMFGCMAAEIVIFHIITEYILSNKLNLE